jgi:hypothetical protein
MLDLGGFVLDVGGDDLGLDDRRWQECGVGMGPMDMVAGDVCIEARSS